MWRMVENAEDRSLLVTVTFDLATSSVRNARIHGPGRTEQRKEDAHTW